MPQLEFLYIFALVGFLIWLALFAIWHSIKTSERRREALDAFRRRPLATTLVFVQFSAVIIFFVGLIVPIIGEIGVADSGLKLWQAAGIVALVTTVVQNFVDIDLE
mgnify:CR=1 FL=1